MGKPLTLNDILKDAGLPPLRKVRQRAYKPRNRIGYEQARSDFEFLEKHYGELSDQVELDSRRLDLMRNPTKPEAAKLYAMACRLWIGEHAVRTDDIKDPRLMAIKIRY